MDIDVTQSSGVAVLSPRGDLDMATVHDVRRALSSIFDRGQSRLLIDLNAVAYIDSSGMGTLIAAMKQALANIRIFVFKRKGEYAVSGPQRQRGIQQRRRRGDRHAEEAHSRV